MRTRFLSSTLIVSMLALVAGITGGGVASAAPAKYHVDTYYSKSMNKQIKAGVIPAGKKNAPTIIMLDGLRAFPTGSGWTVNTDVIKFFTGKGVNVILPFGGAGSFYQDWDHNDPKFGKVKWETFITQELTNQVHKKYGDNPNKRGVIGLSMSGGPAIEFAEKYNFIAAASLSGYPATIVGGAGIPAIGASVAAEGGNAANMWSTPQAWVENNPTVNAPRLRGKHIYVYSGAGILSDNDREIREFFSDPQRAINFAVQAGPLESASIISNSVFIPVAYASGAKMEVDLAAVGSHSWGPWGKHYKEAWNRTFKPAFGMR